jgi:hypothetical protein
VIGFAQVRLVTVPATPLYIVISAKAWRRPALSIRGGVIVIPVRFLGAKARVLGRQTEDGGAVGVAVVLKVLERRIQGRMVVKDVV